MINILLAGVGGQGTILASSLIQNAYLRQGSYVKSTETIGMAQMGGSVNSHIRSGQRVYSPFVPEAGADLVFAFEPAEGARNIKYTNKDTVVIANTIPIKPVTDTLSKEDYDFEKALDVLEGQTRLYRCDFNNLFEEIGTNKPLNIAMVGFALGLDLLGIEKAQIEELLRELMPDKILAMNLRALDYGIEKGRSQLG